VGELTHHGQGAGGVYAAAGVESQGKSVADIRWDVEFDGVAVAQSALK
jgi:hypothetical protein